MPADVPPAGDQRSPTSRVASIAWAIATIVVALVVGLIVWLAVGDRAGTVAGAGASPASPTAPAPPAPAGDPAEASPQPPSPEVQQMMLDLQRRDAGDPLAIGSVDAPVVMIEYADYRCPFCAKFHLEIRPELTPLVDDGTLRIEFRDLVLFEEQSQQSAVAARAAASQDRLAAYQKALFGKSTQGHAELAREDFLAMAREVGVPDLEAFEVALDDEALDALVTADTQEARALGISSTPTFLINTSVVQGAYEAEHMVSVIEQELAKAQQARES
ncbi:MAG: thioredoxin domain-containing protein [Ornithinimicrobium sp.]|uniref:DsbA family protein n=1 Tax=Ornithinimicrobium sp. TaxID=1977084 RepID=UPI0026DEC25A|nr:thioredoxin domain-containing protein [Ornithinimicrobium sp.]MDO5738976.1 thioredoxin domain-containing protein [Ornithinimicrobium sp.]